MNLPRSDHAATTLGPPLRGRPPLVLASSQAAPEALVEIAAGERPRLDYLAVAEALGADVLDTGVGQSLPAWRRRLEGALASDLTQAQVAWSRRGLASGWLSTSEKVGLPLALRGLSPVPHVLIAHNLKTGRKQALHRLTGVLRRFAAILCLSRTQETYLRDVAEVAPERVFHVYDNVDTEFWRPDPSFTIERTAEPEPYLLAVGRENRDYPTLIEAVRQLGLPLVIVASSLWSRRGLGVAPDTLPPHVTLRQDFVSYRDLRALYAGARLVAVPLQPCDYAAGVNGALEAMAMAKATVVTRTDGLGDYLQSGITNADVPPGDPQALAAAIQALWEDGASRSALGAAARARAVREMSLDVYAQRVSAVVRQVIEEGERL